MKALFDNRMWVHSSLRSYCSALLAAFELVFQMSATQLRIYPYPYCFLRPVFHLLRSLHCSLPTLISLNYAPSSSSSAAKSDGKGVQSGCGWGMRLDADQTSNSPVVVTARSGFSLLFLSFSTIFVISSFQFSFSCP
jgi:hypothetical protein